VTEPSRVAPRASPGPARRCHPPIFETVLKGITVTGSIVGTRVDLAETFELHAAGRTTVVREQRRLTEVNEAIRQVEHGDVDARIVFDLS
jgi:alcohol dehydrogenase, propanol-preferring